VLDALEGATPYVLKSGTTAIKRAFAKFITQSVLKRQARGAITASELGRFDLKKAASDFFKDTGKEFLRQYLKPQTAEDPAIEDVPAPAPRQEAEELETRAATGRRRGRPLAEAPARMEATPAPAVEDIPTRMTEGEQVMVEAEAAIREARGMLGESARARPQPTVRTSFLPGDDIAARAAELSYMIVGQRDKRTGEIIEELPDLAPGYDAFQASNGLATFFLSEDEIIVATPGSQRLADWTGPNLALVKGAATGSARDTFERNSQVQATLETIDNIVAGYPGRRLRFAGHSKGAGIALSAYIRFRKAGRDATATVFSTPSLYFRGMPQGFVDGDRVRNYVRQGDRIAAGALEEGASFQPGSVALEFRGGERDDPHSLETMILRDRQSENRMIRDLGAAGAAEEGTEAEVAAELRAEGDPVALEETVPAAPADAPPQPGVPAPEAAPERLEATEAATADTAGRLTPVTAGRLTPVTEGASGVPAPPATAAAMAPAPPAAAPPSIPTGPTVQAPVARREVKAGAGEPRAGERVGSMLADVVDPRIQKAVNVVCHSRNIGFLATLRGFIEDGGVERTAAAVGARGMAGLSRLIACFGSLMEILPFVEDDPLKAEELFAQVACLIDIYTSKADTRYPGEAFSELSAWLKKNLFPVGKSLDDMSDDQKLAQGLRGVVVRLDPSSSREQALAEMAAMSGGMSGGGGGGGGCGGGGGGGGGTGPDHTSGATAADNTADATASAAAQRVDPEPSVVEEVGDEGALLDLNDFLDRSLLDHPPALPQRVPGDEADMFDFVAEESKTEETVGLEVAAARAPEPEEEAGGYGFQWR
jgi:hypothetical protein